MTMKSTYSSCKSCGDFAMEFSGRLNLLAEVFDSTSSTFKDREKRRAMEGEATKALINRGR